MINNYRSSWAADFNNVDVELTSADPIRLAPSRIIWDLNSDYSGGVFVCPVDALYTFTTNLVIDSFVNVGRVFLHIYRNGERWATVVDTEVSVSTSSQGIHSACLCDGLYTNDDYFEIYIELAPIDPTLACSAVVNGSREGSFMGFDLTYRVTPAEIDSED